MFDALTVMPRFAGDVVEKKKPSPDIYLLAAESLGVDPGRCWVVEDSNIGCRAAKAAGMRCLVTKSIYTEEEDFAGADLVVKDLNSGLDGPISVGYLNYLASPRRYKPPSGSPNTDLFAAEPNLTEMFGKITKGKGLPF